MIRAFKFANYEVGILRKNNITFIKVYLPKIALSLSNPFVGIF